MVMSCKGVVPFSRLGHSITTRTLVPSRMLVLLVTKTPLLLTFVVSPVPATGPAIPNVW